MKTLIVSLVLAVAAGTNALVESSNEPTQPAAIENTAPVEMPSALTSALLHCQVPCGIYGDMMRIEAMREDAATIEKGMGQITNAPQNAQGMNQVVRWISTKEDHAAKIQEVVSTYWLTQRIKTQKADADEKAHAHYHQRLAHLHGMLVSAMKCRQTTDPTHVANLRKHIDAFAKLYFSADDLKHLEGMKNYHEKGRK